MNNVFLVYDNADPRQLFIPTCMGVPAEHQMKGTYGEQLSEVCGRICYDSLGAEKSRSSADYHKHIIEVNHSSVLRHYNFTVEVKVGNYNMQEVLMCLLNKPGFYVRHLRNHVLCITLNINCALDWCNDDAMRFGGVYYELGRVFNGALKQLAPAYAKEHREGGLEWYIVGPRDEEEHWVSLYMSGSRGWSHEQVRHSWRCAVSQRSTRYCDESEAPWIEHPLLRDYMAFNDDDEVRELAVETVESSRHLYRMLVRKLELWQQTTGVDRFTARKQARGAARGWLGNALFTEMIFSASVAQWKRMLKQRNNSAADGEIHEMYRDDVANMIDVVTQ